MRTILASCIFVSAWTLATAHAAAITLTESPAELGSWGFRPADGATTELTPPSFTWRPHKEAVGYALEVASDADFETVTYQVEYIPWPAHCPPEAFPAGMYYWRYAAVDKKDRRSSWSKTRPFTVSEKAAVFPMPPLEELQRRIPETHPRLFFRPEEVSHLKELAEGRLATHWANVRAEADKLLERPPDTSEPPKYPEGMQRKGAEWKRIWWGNRQRAVAVANAAATLAFVYRLSGEEPYGAAARDLLLALCTWDPRGSTNYRYNDEAAMPLLYYPARTYTWVYDTLTPEERERVQAMMTVRGGDCFNHLRASRHLWRPYSSHSNRAWHWLGEVAIAFQGEIPEAAEWLDYAMTVFYTCYPVWGVNDGGWHEGAAYWTSYISRFMYWVMVSQAAFDIDPFDKPFFRETGYYGLYLMPPGARTGGFGDQAPPMTSDGIARLMASLAAGARNPHWQWYADTHHVDTTHGYVGFLSSARAGDLEAKPPADLPSSKVFPGAGIAVLNTNLLDGKENIQVHFKSSPLGRQSHGYNANNAFLLTMHGQRVLLRSGRRDVYGSPHHTKWMWHTRSDNAILVNGKGQIPHSPKATGEITAFHTSEHLDIVAGEAGASYTDLDRWTRRILFFKPYAILIHDILEAPEPSTFQWLLHAKGAFDIAEQRVAWKGEPGAIEVRFLEPAGLATTQTDEFEPPPHAWAKFELGEYHLTAQTTERSATRQFITLIVIENAAVNVTCNVTSERGATVQLTLPEGAATVCLEDARFSIVGDGLAYASEAAATRPKKH